MNASEAIVGLVLGVTGVAALWRWAPADPPWTLRMSRWVGAVPIILLGIPVGIVLALPVGSPVSIVISFAGTAAIFGALTLLGWRGLLAVLLSTLPRALAGSQTDNDA